MVLVLFRSQLRPESGDEYAETATRMEALVRTLPGFVSFKSYTAQDGDRLSVGAFESEEALQAWRRHPDHLAAQKRGRDAFYQFFDIQVAEVVRSYGFERTDERAG